ncbi:hypothetical protein C8F04DRAFT_1281902 [Mycena alexandri]|uniref:Uncharacterized protein n=1 Tax=Mycena alexandri TaxID=1745969 RepID=A0AAD6RVY8_9AGAR|nr:hypothetical protein C8F04DRAFT_1281902 [Mycena alexandri]
MQRIKIPPKVKVHCIALQRESDNTVIRTRHHADQSRPINAAITDHISSHKPPRHQTPHPLPWPHSIQRPPTSPTSPIEASAPPSPAAARFQIESPASPSSTTTSPPVNAPTRRSTLSSSSHPMPPTRSLRSHVVLRCHAPPSRRAPNSLYRLRDCLYPTPPAIDALPPSPPPNAHPVISSRLLPPRRHVTSRCVYFPPHLLPNPLYPFTVTSPLNSSPFIDRTSTSPGPCVPLRDPFIEVRAEFARIPIAFRPSLRALLLHSSMVRGASFDASSSARLNMHGTRDPQSTVQGNQTRRISIFSSVAASTPASTPLSGTGHCALVIRYRIFATLLPMPVLHRLPISPSPPYILLTFPHACSAPVLLRSPS